MAENAKGILAILGQMYRAFAVRCQGEPIAWTFEVLHTLSLGIIRIHSRFDGDCQAERSG